MRISFRISYSRIKYIGFPLQYTARQIVPNRLELKMMGSTEKLDPEFFKEMPHVDLFRRRGLIFYKQIPVVCGAFRL